jgi:ureidoglycolate hydrolase
MPTVMLDKDLYSRHVLDEMQSLTGTHKHVCTHTNAHTEHTCANTLQPCNTFTQQMHIARTHAHPCTAQLFVSWSFAGRASPVVVCIHSG